MKSFSFLRFVCICLCGFFALSGCNSKKQDAVDSLVKSCEDGNVEAVKILLNTGTKVNKPNRKGKFALEAAACSTKPMARLELTKLLLEAGANVNLGTPLTSAVICARSMSVKSAIENVAYGIYTFDEIEALSNLELVNLLIGVGANVNEKNSQKNTPLMYAETQLMAKLLIDKGANVNSKNDKGETPLILACLHGYPEVVQVLAEKNADVDAKSKEKLTPLFASLKFGGYSAGVKSSEKYDQYVIDTMNQMLQTLISYRADVNLAGKADKYDPDGFTPLMQACDGAKEDAISMLLRAGANVNVKDGFGKYPIHHCKIANGLKALLASKAVNVNQPNEGGRTPLMEAANDGNIEAMGVLFQHNADVNIQDKWGYSALMHAIDSAYGWNMHSKKDTVQSLLFHGANPFLKNKKGKTAMDIAQEENEQAVMATLHMMEKMLKAKGVSEFNFMEELKQEAAKKAKEK